MSLTRYPARFFERAAWDSVSCRLCPQLCSIAPSRSGTCGARTNRDGTLYLDHYGKISHRQVVPSESIPLFEFKPSANWLMLGSKGCTMRCPFCNTFKCSQTGGVRTEALFPQQIVDIALEAGVQGISFGISEPAPIHEFVQEVFTEASRSNLQTHLATSCMWSNEPFRQMLPLVSAVTVGLKGLDPALYQRQLGGDIPTVLANLDLMLALSVHVEITWLVIPGMTDGQDQIARLLEVIRRSEKRPPILLLPYAPDFTWAKNASPAAATLNDLHRVREAFTGYEGSLYEVHPESSEQNTRCHKCSRVLVRRGLSGLIITPLPIERQDCCPNCGTKVPYVL